MTAQSDRQTSPDQRGLKTLRVLEGQDRRTDGCHWKGTGPRVHEHSQAYQLPVLNARRDLARVGWWSAILHLRRHEVYLLCVRHAS